MSYAKRLSKAREDAGLTQRELAKCVGISQQAVQKLESRPGVGSRYTTQIAAALNVSAAWLATGKGPQRVHQIVVPPGMEPTNAEAQEIASAWMRLPPALQASFKTMLFSMASAHSVARWLSITPPKGDSYDAWEKAIQDAYDREIKQMKLDLGD